LYGGAFLALLRRPLQPGGRGGHPLVVDARVLGQVVGPRKPLVAHVTPVWLDARMRPTVPRQLVRSGETPSAARPHAPVRLLARMSPHVHLWTRKRRRIIIIMSLLIRQDYDTRSGGIILNSHARDVLILFYIGYFTFYNKLILLSKLYTFL